MFIIAYLRGWLVSTVANVGTWTSNWLFIGCFLFHLLLIITLVVVVLADVSSSSSSSTAAAGGAPIPAACPPGNRIRRARRGGGGCAGAAASCVGRRAINSVNLASSLVSIIFSTPSIASVNLVSMSYTCSDIICANLSCSSLFVMCSQSGASRATSSCDPGMDSRSRKTHRNMILLLLMGCGVVGSTNPSSFSFVLTDSYLAAGGDVQPTGQNSQRCGRAMARRCQNARCRIYVEL